MIFFKYKNIKFKMNLFLILLLSVYIYFGYIVEIIVILLTIFVHELSHALMAERMGIRVSELEVFPFGGVAKLDSIIGPDPRIEIIVSIIGPMVNLILTIAFKMIRVNYGDSLWLDYIINANMYMGLFNLLPLFPLDGGRIVRGAISYLIGFKTATSILTYITYCVSLVAISYGAFSYITEDTSIYLILIAIFISIAAKKENKMAAFIFIKEITDKKMKLLEKGVMKIQPLVVLSNVSSREIIRSFLPKKYHIITIIDGKGRTLGTLNETELLEGIVEKGYDVEIEKLLIKHKKW